MLNGALACYGVYSTRDGKFLSVGALEPKFWLAFNEAIGRNAHAGEVILPEQQQQLIRNEVADILNQKTQAEWVAIFEHHDCCTEAVLELHELQSHPLYQSRNLFFTIPCETGDSLQVRTPVGRASATSPAPGHGQHSREILQEYGFSSDEIAELLSKR